MSKAIKTFTVAQGQLLPDTAQPIIGQVGNFSVVKAPGLMLWDLTFSEPLGSPDFAPIIQVIGDPTIVALVNLSTVPFPPTGPVTNIRIALTNITGGILTDYQATVAFRLDRKGPTGQP